MSPLTDILVGVMAGSLFLGGVGVGAGVFVLIGRLTGGAWSRAPALTVLARWSLAPILVAVITRAALTFLLPLAGGSAGWWLSPPLEIVRLIVIGAAWIGLVWGVGRPISPLIAGIGLVLYGLTVSLAAVDLVTSLEPGWVSSAEGMALAVRQLGATLAAVVLLTPDETRVRRDLMGLLVAALLATLYLNLMSYIVPWYGDLAEKTGWIRLREGAGWRVLLIAALGLGALSPLGLFGAFGRQPGALRLGAGLALSGFFAQGVWLAAPGYGPSAVLAAVIVGALGVAAPMLGRSSSRLAHVA